jgi:hypothetical protein
MKKIVSALLVCFLLVGSMFALVSCGGGIKNGTYESEGMTVIIKGDEFKITYDLEEFGLGMGAEGTMEMVFTYELKEDDKEIVLTYKEFNLDLDIPGLEGEEKETAEKLINGMLEGMVDEMKEEMTEPSDFEFTDNGFIIEEMEFTKK